MSRKLTENICCNKNPSSCMFSSDVLYVIEVLKLQCEVYLWSGQVGFETKFMQQLENKLLSFFNPKLDLCSSGRPGDLDQGRSAVRGGQTTHKQLQGVKKCLLVRLSCPPGF